MTENETMRVVFEDDYGALSPVEVPASAWPLLEPAVRRVIDATEDARAEGVPPLRLADYFRLEAVDPASAVVADLLVGIASALDAQEEELRETVVWLSIRLFADAFAEAGEGPPFLAHFRAALEELRRDGSAREFRDGTVYDARVLAVVEAWLDLMADD